MTFESKSKPFFWILLMLALAFAIHLYPGPAERARLLMSGSDSSEIGDQTNRGKAQGDTVVTREEREAVNAMARRGWFMNLLLMATGGVGAAMWLLFRRTRMALVISLASLALFITLFALAVVPSRLADMGAWLDLMTRVASVGGWAFLAAELHRISALLFGLIGIGLVAMSFRKLRGAS